MEKITSGGWNTKKYQQHLEQSPQVKSLKMTAFFGGTFSAGQDSFAGRCKSKQWMNGNLLNNTRGLSKHASYMSQSEHLMILSNGGLVTLNKRFFIYLKHPLLSHACRLMSNEHLPSACSKNPFSHNDIGATEVLTWICPCISCELLHRPVKNTNMFEVLNSLLLGEGNCRFDLVDVTKRYIYIYAQ